MKSIHYIKAYRHMQKHGQMTGCLSPLTLNYDYVFLALARTAIAGEKW